MKCSDRLEVVLINLRMLALWCPIIVLKHNKMHNFKDVAIYDCLRKQ